MGRPTRVLATETVVSLQPLSTKCLACGNTGRVAYHTEARGSRPCKVISVSRLAVRRCHREACPRYHRPYRPEEGQWALPYGEYGLDVIALIGMLRYRHHHSLAELHQALRDRGMVIGERTGRESPGPL